MRIGGNGGGTPGPRGLPGRSINFKTAVATFSALPAGYEDDARIVLDEGNIYIHNGTSWVDGGQFQGPEGAASTVAGPTGPTGATGAAGAAGGMGNQAAYTPSIYAGSTIGAGPGTAGTLFAFTSPKTASSDQVGSYATDGKLVQFSATITWVNVTNMASITTKIADADITSKAGFYITLPATAARTGFIYGGVTVETSGGNGTALAGSKYEAIIGKTTAGSTSLHLFTNEKEPKPFDYERPFGNGGWTTSKGSTMTFSGVYEKQ